MLFRSLGKYNMNMLLLFDAIPLIPTVCLSSLKSYIPGENWHYLKWVALGSVALGLPSVAIKAFRTLRRYKFDVNCLILVGK